MTSLGSKINSLNFSAELPAIKELLDKATPKITFWGGRIVTVAGYTGSLYLDDLAIKIYEASEETLAPEKRIAGAAITAKLRTFYDVTNDLVKKSHFFTRLLTWIREFSFFEYTPPFYLKESALLWNSH